MKLKLSVQHPQLVPTLTYVQLLKAGKVNQHLIQELNRRAFAAIKLQNDHQRY